jgi:hypothetical protein
MELRNLLKDLYAEKVKVEKAIAALEALDSTAGMPTTTLGDRSPAATQHGGRRRMSAAGRKRISEAAKKRWALQKAQAAPAKKTGKKAAPTRHISPAARKAMSEAAKKRWAAQKKTETA